MANFEGHNGQISGLAFSENGYYLATCAEDSCIKLWDLRKLKNFKTIQLEDGYEVRDVSFDQSGSQLDIVGLFPILKLPRLTPSNEIVPGASSSVYLICT